MKQVRIIISMIISTVKLVLKRICGCRIQFGMINLISPFSHIYTEKSGHIEIGSKTGVKPGTEIKASDGGEINIGSNCHLNRNCMVIAHEKIDIEDGVTIGPGTYIYDHDHNGNGGYDTKPVKIEKNAWIGANCVILKGVTIGEGAVIAAGGVVSKDVPAHTTMYQKRESIYKKCSP